MDLVRCKADFLRLTAEDAASFDGFMAAMALPKDDPSRAAKMQEALAHAAEVPLKTAQKAAEAHAAVKAAASDAAAAVASDMNCALHLLKAAALCAGENVRINTGSLKDQDKAKDLEGRLSQALAAV